MHWGTVTKLIYFLLCLVRYVFSGIKMVSSFNGLTYKNIGKMTNKMFNVPNHLWNYNVLTLVELIQGFLTQKEPLLVLSSSLLNLSYT